VKGQTQLLEADPQVRWDGSRAVVPIERGACPACGAPPVEVVFGEPQMFRHGGYGATRETVVDVCTAPPLVCRWTLVRSVTEIRPA
jgi:hypothetical protein